MDRVMFPFIVGRPYQWLTLIVLVSGQASASDSTAMDHYQAVTEIRESQWPILGNEDATPQELEAALIELQRGLNYLDQPLIRELALGNLYLYYRGYNIRRDMAALYARLDRPGKVAEQLRRLREFGVSAGSVDRLREELPSSIQSDVSVAAELSAWEALDRLASGHAFETDFSPDIGQAEKVAGLSRVWKMAGDHFVHFDQVPALDWDRAYLETIDRVLDTSSTADYYRELMRFMARLEDGHSNVYPPDELHDQFYSRPPMMATRLGDQVIVHEVRSPELRALGLVPGVEVLAIDGQDVHDYVREHVQPYQSSSTQQDLDVRSYGYALFSGPADLPLSVKVRFGDGSEETLSVPRAGYDTIDQRALFERRTLSGGVEYLALDEFSSDRALEVWESAWPEIIEAPALILDLRNNGGGSSWPGYRILAHLIDQPVLPGRSWSRSNDSLRLARAPSVDFDPLESTTIEPIEGPRFQGPVVLLVGPRTFSAAEDMAMAFAVSGRGTIVGQATAGSTGQPLFFQLPGGGVARICAKRDTWPDGSDLVGKGVLPDVEVISTQSDFESGRDVVLEAGLEVLRNL